MASSDIIVSRVESKADLKAFIDLPKRLFAGQKGKDLQALAACMRKARTVYSSQRLAIWTGPLLVVCGEMDNLTGRPDGLAAAFPAGRAVTIAGRDHMTAVGDKLYKRAVLDFLA